MRDGKVWSFLTTKKNGTISNSVAPQYMSENKKGFLKALFYTTAKRVNNTKYM